MLDAVLDLPLELVEPVRRVSADLRDAAKLLDRDQARYLVDFYYQIQDFRIVAASRIRAQEHEPNRLLGHVFSEMDALETIIKNALGIFAKQYTVGRWLRSICGIGPVISAGFLAHLDVRGRKTAGAFWRFAGLEPTVKWEKGKKRPFNAALKVLCWKAGESFVKVQNNESDFYGKIFVARKERERNRNDSGLFGDQAAAILEAKRIGKTTEAFKHYSAGHLPPAQIHARARRYAVKMLLSHLHHVMYSDFYGENPPLPFIIGRPGATHVHTDYIPPPNWPIDDPGLPLTELLKEPNLSTETKQESETNSGE